VRSRVQSLTPKRAAELLEANTTNRPLSRPVVRGLAEAMKRGAWLVTHQGIAFDVHGVLVDGQHRLAAIIEADLPVELTVFTEVAEGTFDVLDTGKRRNAADVLAIEGEKNSMMLAAMVRTVWLYENRPDLGWSGGKAAVTNHQIVHTLDLHPRLREFLSVGERVAAATGMIKSAAGAASYLVEQANKRADLTGWFDGIVDGAGLQRQDPRLLFRRVMFAMARKQAGQVQPGAAPPRHPRACRPLPQGIQRLGHRRADHQPALHPTREHAPHRQGPLNPVRAATPRLWAGPRRLRTG
jgi:hypothetical protein